MEQNLTQELVFTVKYSNFTIKLGLLLVLKTIRTLKSELKRLKTVINDEKL